MSQLCHASWMPDILWSSRLLALSAVRRPSDSTLQWLKEIHVTVRIWIELGKLSFDNQSVHQSSQAWVLVTRQVDNLSNWRVFIPSYWLSGFLDISEIFWSTQSRKGHWLLMTSSPLRIIPRRKCRFQSRQKKSDPREIVPSLHHRTQRSYPPASNSYTTTATEPVLRYIGPIVDILPARASW